MKKRLIIVLAVLIFVFLALDFSFERNIELTGAMSLEALKALPYLDYSEEDADIIKSGVTIYEKELTFDGYNFVRDKIIDMDGNQVHLWSWLNFVKILDEGKVFANHKDKIGLYYWNSTPIWEKDILVHHELALSQEGILLAVSSEVHKYKNRDVEFDVIMEFDLEGNELSYWSTYDNLLHLKEHHKMSKLDVPALFYDNNCERSKFGGCYEYYHLNSLESLPETELGKKDKRFQKGNWLISLPYFNLVVILDRETKEVVWSWGSDELGIQHMPRMLKNGNILIYDNGKYVRDYSRVIEVDPVKNEIVWEYKADPPQDFYSATQGSAQRLPNGNTLIIESEEGRAFEVTKEGKIVWEWYNPEINEDGKRRGEYRMIRIPKEKVDKWLENQSS